MTITPFLVALSAFVALLGGCPRAAAPPSEPSSGPTSARAPVDPLARLYDVEEVLRRAIAADRRPPGPGGADPRGLAVLDDGGALVALAGASALLRLDARGREIARAPSARGAHDVALAGGYAYVIGTGDGRLLRHALTAADAAGGGLGPPVTLVDDLFASGALAAAQNAQRACVVVADGSDALHVLPLLASGQPAAGPTPARTRERTHGLRWTGVDAFGDLIVARATVEHAAVVFRADASCGLTEIGRVVHDAPLSAAAAFTDVDGAVHLVVAGVEDRPLDRSGGFFGALDSEVTAYRFDGKRPVQRWRTNVGERGLVNVTALLLEGASRAPTAVLAFAGGSAAAVRLAVNSGQSEPPVPMTPVSDAQRGPGPWLWTTSAIADVIVLHRAGTLGAATARVLRPEGGPPREPLVALGEALARTSLMSERPTSEGLRSQVSCESCHPGLAVDGRTHFTGREREGEHVVATTRSLFGLLQARPHFSRALDKTTTKMVDNEFRVMAKGTAGSARFDLRVADHPWLTHLGHAPNAVLDPLVQREALMRFFASQPPPPSPAVRERRRAGAGAFTPQEARGAEVFEARCARCHAPRTLLDDERTTVARARWAEHIFGDKASLVFARPGYEKTGVTPYVHADGARPAPLFGLWKKRPLFTTGEAVALEALLSAVRDRPDGFLHRPPADDDTQGALNADEQQALKAFLDLL